MKIDEAIDKTILASASWELEDNEVEALQMLINAGRKHIPKKPIWESGHCYCPNKHKSVVKGAPYWTIGTGQQYCDFCGQAIDWSDDDEIKRKL